MARQSASSLSVVQVGGRVRLPPPADLTPDQSALWVAVTESKPVEWFGEDSAPLLTEYVRAVTMSSWLTVQVDAAMMGDDVALLEKFLRLRDMEAKRVTSLATKMRLSQQSRYTDKSAGTADRKASSGGKPWQFNGR